MSAVMEEQTPIVWSPLPGSQVLALSCPADEVFFEGTRGPGKTDTQLMRFRMRVGLGYGRFWRGIIFDREYKNLDDIVSKAQRWFNQFDDGARFAGSGAAFGWTWPSGEQLLFRHIKRAKDYWLYHGHEYPFIGWNELTKYPTRELYDLMMSTNRSSFTAEKYPVVMPHAQALAFGCSLVRDVDDETGEYLLPPIPLEVFSTLNPYGPGHNWVKHDVIDAAPPGAVVRSVVNVFNPRTQQREDVTRTRCRIFGSYKENQFLDPKYIAELESIKDENRKRAWLYGDWDIVSGGAFDDVWNSDKCVVDRFQIPDNWYCDRSFDWGSTHPYWCGWWAESNGEEVKMPDGTKRSFSRGSLILIDELYGTKRVGTNSGLRQSPRTVAELIRDQEKELRKVWCKAKIYAGPADNQIFDVRETDDNDDPETIATKMEEQGVTWERSDKSKGSRKNGFELLRDRLRAAADGEGPGIYFMRHCTGAIETLPVLPRDDDNIDDVDTDAEDHPYDGVRYRCLKGSNKRLSENVKVKFPT